MPSTTVHRPRARLHHDITSRHVIEVVKIMSAGFVVTCEHASMELASGVSRFHGEIRQS